MRQLYVSWVKPVMYYMNPVWYHRVSKNHRVRFETVHNLVLGRVLGISKWATWILQQGTGIPPFYFFFIFKRAERLSKRLVLRTLKGVNPRNPGMGLIKRQQPTTDDKLLALFFYQILVEWYCWKLATVPCDIASRVSGRTQTLECGQPKMVGPLLVAPYVGLSIDPWKKPPRTWSLCLPWQ